MPLREKGDQQSRPFRVFRDGLGGGGVAYALRRAAGAVDVSLAARLAHLGEWHSPDDRDVEPGGAATGAKTQRGLLEPGRQADLLLAAVRVRGAGGVSGVGVALLADALDGVSGRTGAHDEGAEEHIRPWGR